MRSLITATCLLVGGIMSGCGSSPTAGPDPCSALTNEVDADREVYLAKAEMAKAEVSKKHLRLRAFDKRLIPIIVERREFLLSALFADKSLDVGIKGCKGEHLASIRAAATEEILKENGVIQALKEESK